MTEPARVDLLVIGAGPAGEKGAAYGAYLGKSVCLVERAPKPGGTMVNAGAIPTKALRETALSFAGLKRRGLHGVEYHVQTDISLRDFMFRERLVVEAQWAQIAANLEQHRMNTVQGTAHFVGPQTIEVARYRAERRHITADAILIATGSRPSRPAEIPFDDEVIVDAESVLQLARIPARMVILGGTSLACEYASSFAALGVKVTLIAPDAHLVPGLDVEVSDLLRTELTRQLGISVLLHASPTEIRRDGAVASVRLADGMMLYADCVLSCGAREASSADLDLDVAGIRTDQRGFIAVDAHFRTSAPRVYAVGDVLGQHALASIAMEQARLAVCDAFDLRHNGPLAPVIPLVVWSIPEVAMVGATEEAARQSGHRYEIGKASFSANARGQILGDEGLVKLLFDPESLRLLGASIVGENACELIHMAATVMMMDGTIDVFIQSVYAYPTMADAFKDAAYDGLQRVAQRTARSEGLRTVSPWDD